MPEKRRRQPWERDMRVRVKTPPDAAETFTAHLVFTAGYCTQAEPPLQDCLGRSAPWLYGYVRYRGWRASIVPEQPALALA
jgi:hypothetical protein